MNSQGLMIAGLIILFLYNNQRLKNIKSLENMDNCSSGSSDIEEHALLEELKELCNKYTLKLFYEKLIDFKNIENDNNPLINDLNLLDKKEQDNFIDELNILINSYRAFNPIYDININSSTKVVLLKDNLLKNIILNNLSCYGAIDSELFWVKLHLLGKKDIVSESSINLPNIESFNNEIKSLNKVDLEEKEIISYNLHQQNILIKLLEKNKDLAKIINNFNLINENNIKETIDGILVYLGEIDNKDIDDEDKKLLYKQSQDLYQDLSQLIYLDRALKNNKHLKLGFSEDGETIILNKHIYDNENVELLINKTENNLKDLIDNITVFNNNYERSNFYKKVRTYLEYHKVKVPSYNKLEELDLSNLELNELEINMNKKVELLLFHYILKLRHKTEVELHNKHILEILNLEGNITRIDLSDKRIPFRLRKINWLSKLI